MALRESLGACWLVREHKRLSCNTINELDDSGGSNSLTLLSGISRGFLKTGFAELGRAGDVSS
jgi:hypothetical protein